MLRLIALFIFFALLSVAQADEWDDLATQIAEDLTELDEALSEVIREQSLSRDHAPRLLDNVTVEAQITADAAALYADADPNAEIINTAKEGETFVVLDRVKDWYGIAPAITYTPGQGEAYFGANVISWVRERDVSIKATFHPENTLRPVQVAPRLTSYERLAQQAIAIKRRSDNNPYMRVTGFTVQLGPLPSVSISFEFKE
jgi:hypothetical protein